MYRLSVTALALACALAATPAAAHAATQATTHATTHAATRAATAAKPSLRGCYDGKCTFTFTRPVSFRVSSKYGFPRVRVSKVDADTVAVRTASVRRIRGQLHMTGGNVFLGEGGWGSSGSLSFRVLSVTERGATIRFTG
ncbi:hypothetical protein [Nonomuraea candida]|uniref:hypothetical protein n=1 Tax=Nonomuraea candida TaxID=359159 RepID=UPI0005BB8BF9|nr:hypothetical protein [Nonomuraea candida]